MYKITMLKQILLFKKLPFDFPYYFCITEETVFIHKNLLNLVVGDAIHNWLSTFKAWLWIKKNIVIPGILNDNTRTMYVLNDDRQHYHFWKYELKRKPINIQYITQSGYKTLGTSVIYILLSPSRNKSLNIERKDKRKGAEIKNHCFHYKRIYR